MSHSIVYLFRGSLGVEHNANGIDQRNHQFTCKFDISLHCPALLKYLPKHLHLFRCL